MAFDLGPTWDTAVFGFIRATFGFSIGMLIARTYTVSPNGSWLALLLVLAIIALMFVPLSLIGEGLCIALLLPLIVVGGARLDPPPKLTACSRLLGEASYPMYAIHWALIFPLQGVGRAARLSDWLVNTLIVIIIFCCAIAISRLYEVPARRALTNWFGKRPLLMGARSEG